MKFRALSDKAGVVRLTSAEKLSKLVQVAAGLHNFIKHHANIEEQEAEASAGETPDQVALLPEDPEEHGRRRPTREKLKNRYF